MKHASKTAVNSIVAIIVATVILLLLFTLPGRYLDRVTGRMDAFASAAISAALSGEFDSALENAAALKDAFYGCSDPMKLIVNHEDVDELEALIMATYRLAQVQDDAELLIQLERIRGTLRYLSGIETFDIYDLF